MSSRGGVCRGRTQSQTPFKRRCGINLKVSRDHFGRMADLNDCAVISH